VSLGELDKTDVERVRSAADRALATANPQTTAREDYLRAWFDNGLTWVHFPHGLGGLDVSRRLQPLADSILLDATGEHPRIRNKIGYGVAAPTVVACAEPSLARELAAGIATGRQIWCQLFSEPEAGSDLANVMTSAVRIGPGWLVNGQKVWSSQAHRASWGLLLARTDPDVSKHRGLTLFAVNMQQRGVDVRPLRQITGEAEFNEVFLTDVRIPDRYRLGPEGEGWRVARSTLANERMGIADRHGDGGPSAIADVFGVWEQCPGARTPALADQLVQLWVDVQVHRLTCDRYRAASRSGAAPGQEAAIAKLVGAELNQRAYDLAIDLLGIDAGLYDSFEPDAVAGQERMVQRRFLRSRANTIEGGTSEILRNVVAERVLGMPPEPPADRDATWRELRSHRASGNGGRSPGASDA
jgi:alkylation response protein AidB-like acyl-CoA dehydrogenase